MENTPTASEIYHNRDAETAIEVSRLMELKYFDTQFLYYGVAYAEQGRVKYRLHDNAERMVRFVGQCAEKGLYPTEIRSRTTLKKAPSGHEQIVAEEARQEFVELLKQEYPVEFYRGLTGLGETVADNTAEERLREEQKKLEYCYDPDKIQLFQGLVQMAFEQKVLQPGALQEFRTWSRKRLEVIRDCTNIFRNRKKTFYGYRYLENGVWHSYCNGDLITAEKRRYEAMVQGMVCTPMAAKDYWLDSCPDKKIPLWKAEAEAYFNTLMDEAYLACLLDLRNMHNHVDAEKLAELIHRMEQQNAHQAVRTLRYYQNCWNV